MKQNMFKFEWDQEKAKANHRKHRVSFEEAVSVFGDHNALTFADPDHSETEDRSRTFGLSNLQRVLVVIHTDRRLGIRIISARKATKYEENIYQNG